MEIANLIQAVSAVKADNTAGRAGKGQSDFSDKLAAALDHVMPAEKTALKSTETKKEETSKDGKATGEETASRDAAATEMKAAKSDKEAASSDKDVSTSVKEDKAETKDVAESVKDLAAAAVNMGMVWLQAPIVTPVAATETAAAATAVVSAVGQLAVSTGLLGTAGQALSKEGHAAQIQTGKNGIMENGYQAAVTAVDTNLTNAVAASQETAKTNAVPNGQKLELAATSILHGEAGDAGQAAENLEASETSVNNTAAALTPKTAETVQAENVATSGNKSVKTEISAPENTVVVRNAQKTVSSQTDLIDPAIQKDVVAINVSTTPTTLSNTVSTATQGKDEIKTNSETQEPLSATGAVTEVPVKANESKESKQDLLNQFAGSNEKKLVEKTDESVAASVSFEKMMPAVDNNTPLQGKAPEQRTDTYEVARQVMEGMKSSVDRLQNSQVIITLKPEHLGEVTVKINVDGDRVTAAFHAANSEVRAILESSLPQLKQEMSHQGWNFDSDGVYGGLQQFMGNQQQKPQEQPVVQMPIRRTNEVYDDAVAFTGSGNIQIMSAAAVDYRI